MARQPIPNFKLRVVKSAQLGIKLLAAIVDGPKRYLDREMVSLLTIDEAERLRNALNKILNRETIRVELDGPNS